MTIPWNYRCVVLAPTGKPLLWTVSNSKSAAIELAFGGQALWPYAMQNGYRLAWLKETRDEWAPGTPVH